MQRSKYLNKIFQNKKFFINPEAISDDEISFINKIFVWMTLALLVTAFISMFLDFFPSVAKFIFQHHIIWVLIIIEITIALILSVNAEKMSFYNAKLALFSFSVLHGLVFSVIFLIYSMSSITRIFLLTAATFLIMTLYGHFTKIDLTTIQSLTLMLLCGFILCTFVNYYFGSEPVQVLMSYFSILMYVILIAYDTEEIKDMYVINKNSNKNKISSINASLMLFLDFINLFLNVIVLFVAQLISIELDDSNHGSNSDSSGDGGGDGGGD